MRKIIVGVDIGGTNFRIAKVDETGRLFDEKCQPRTSLHTCRKIEQAMGDYIENYLCSGEQLAGICLAFATTMSKDRGTILSGPSMHEFNGADMVGYLSQRFQTEMFMQKDTDVLFTYDITQKKISKDKTAIGIYVGTGIGNAMYLNGDIFSGSHGVAGELGHIPIPGKTGLCGCGNRGCAEMYAGGKRLVEIMEEETEHIDIETLFCNYDMKPKLQEYIEILSSVIAVEINIIDPDITILGGGVVNMQGFPREDLKAHVRKHIRKPEPYASAEILYSEGGPFQGVIGAVIYAGRKLGMYDRLLEQLKIPENYAST